MPTTCPSCGSEIPVGDCACPACGFDTQNDRFDDDAQDMYREWDHVGSEAW